ncbi:PREDICTED: glutathione S-transferase APIC-like [Ipomoea nil]|uniref:glutathione S-transferase APIC-like n=1 Tax=Ipomoea nil TaxID=35883 RepID=UPI000901DFBB|nr:PREDICTED: glutathione S-transferase APIC-like [Ipomoea nil]
MAAALNVYGNPISIATMRVLACVYQKGLKCYINHPINAPIGEEKSLFGEVPALKDGSSKIYGSRAITSYLACKYGEQGTELIPRDGARMAAMFELMDMEVRRLDPVVSKIAWDDTRMKGIMEMVSGCESDDAVEKHKKQLEGVLDLYEERIKTLGYFPETSAAAAGKNGRMMTLADVNHMPLFHYLANTPSLKGLVDGRPAVKKWSDFILGSGAWGKVTDTHVQPN